MEIKRLYEFDLVRLDDYNQLIISLKNFSFLKIKLMLPHLACKLNLIKKKSYKII